MAYSLVQVADAELGAMREQELFTLHIRKALQDAKHFVVVKLRSDMVPGVELLESIERWVKLCQTAGRQLVVLPETADQFECLELSHPDQNIVYVPPGAELEGSFGAPETALAEPAEQTAGTGQRVDRSPEEAHPVDVAPVGAEPAGSSPSSDDLSTPLWTSIDAGAPEQVTVANHDAKVTISGEYECLSCHMPRTWLRGDVITDCENKECLNPRAGYRLTFDLF